MNTKYTTFNIQNSHLSELEKVVRSSGMVVLHCDAEGKLFSNQHADWLVDLFAKSPVLQQAVSSNCEVWNTQDAPKVSEAFHGVWIVPVKKGRGLRFVGYAIGVIMTEELCSSEYLHVLCQASGADATVVRDMIQSLSPSSSQDVDRLATLFQFAWNSQASREVDQGTMESVGQELADSYEEINLLYTITGSMNSVNHPERFIELACNELLQTLPYEWIGVQLRIGDRLPRIGCDVVVAGQVGQTIQQLSSAVRSVSDDITIASPIISNGEDALADRLGSATIIEPIVSDGRVIGVLVAANKLGEDLTASSVDIKLLSATAAQLAIFLKNALLYEDLNATFLGTLEALTATIDAKDQYTCGHSERVALLTSQLAAAAGLHDDQVDRCRIAGLVHDIGKIGVPEHVLLKKGELTEDEFQSIHKHPEIGARILRDIPQMEDILGGVLHHHERFDGGGYPHGISGTDIPLVARMIALADTFDAMSSSRTYRNAMTRASVLQGMAAVVGTQFDPELAKIFFELDFSKWEQLMIDHQVRIPITDERGVA